MKNNQQGFTLLELMITVGIVAILAGLAISGYDYATLKTRRAGAQQCLVSAAQAMERAYTANMTYAGAAIPACQRDTAEFYTIGFSAGPTATTYTLRVAPRAGTKAVKDKCGAMTLDQTGAKTASATDCW